MGQRKMPGCRSRRDLQPPNGKGGSSSEGGPQSAEQLRPWRTVPIERGKGNDQITEMALRGRWRRFALHLPVPVLSGQIQHGSVTRLAALPSVWRALGRRTRMSTPCGPAVGLGPLWSPSALGIGLGQRDAGCRSRVGDLVPDAVVRRTMERLGRGHRQSEPGRGRRFVAVRARLSGHVPRPTRTGRCHRTLRVPGNNSAESQHRLTWQPAPLPRTSSDRRPIGRCRPVGRCSFSPIRCRGGGPATNEPQETSRS